MTMKRIWTMRSEAIKRQLDYYGTLDVAIGQNVYLKVLI